jgi:hypothetical protein
MRNWAIRPLKNLEDWKSFIRVTGTLVLFLVFNCTVYSQNLPPPPHFDGLNLNEGMSENVKQLHLGESLVSKLILSNKNWHKYYNKQKHSFSVNQEISISNVEFKLPSQDLPPRPQFLPFSELKADGFHMFNTKCRFHFVVKNLKIERGPGHTFFIEKCYFDHLHMWNVDAAIKLEKVFLKFPPKFTSISNSLTIQNNSLPEYGRIAITGSNILLDIKQPVIQLFSSENSFDGVYIRTHLQNKSNFQFSNDSIGGVNLIWADVGSEPKSRQSAAQFRNCVFKNQSSLKTKNIKKISIINCFFEEATSLNLINPPGEKLDLELYDSNLKNLELHFSDYINLIFPKEASESEIEANYLNLLDKYQGEKDKESYKNVDILYKKYRWSTYSVIGPIVNFIDRWWWNYGYSKDYIILYTFLFLLIFFTLNLIVGYQIHDFYPVFSRKVVATDRNRSAFNYVVVTFVLTTYIFFSLKVDFDKIDTRNTKFVVYFFIQYFLGLVCLFFLFGAIFKF